MHIYFIYWSFRQHLQQKNTFKHFQEAKYLDPRAVAVSHYGWLKTSYGWLAAAYG